MAGIHAGVSPLRRIIQWRFLSANAGTYVLVLSIVCTALVLDVETSTPAFLPPMTYDSAGILAISVAVADLNADGHPDVVTANELSTNVGVLLNTGDGTFQPAVSYALEGLFAQAVAIADVNHDSRPDLVVAVRCSNSADCSGLVEVLLGNGDGTFQRPVSHRTGGESGWSVAVADMNIDGNLDLVVVNEVSNTVGLLMGDGLGAFQPAVTYDSGGRSPRSVVVRDVNADGKQDVILVNNCSGVSGCLAAGTVSVLLGAGNGQLQPAVTYATGGDSPIGLAVADLNGDGHLDVAVANACSAANMCSVGTAGVLIGRGDGTFEPAVSYGSNGFGTRSIAVADVNLDGRFDLVVASLCVVGGGCLDGTVAVLLGNGEGMFQIAANYSSGGNGAESVVVADVNGDGGPDVVVANDACPSTVCGGAGVGVLLNNLTDHEAPIITISAFPNILWPPNSMMVPVAVSGNISDSGSGVKQGSPRYSVIDEYGKVQPSGPISLAPGGNYSVVVWLQASRDGSDRNGRRYSITVSATDYAGNNGSNQSSVVVPHDSARGR